MGSEKKHTARQLRIFSTTENLELARQFVAESARKHGFTQDDIDKITVAVDEACTNIIRHAYKKAPNKEIDIEVRVEEPKRSPRKFMIIIEDHGAPFDPTTYRAPDLQNYFKEYRVGGLGIFLMNKLMDEVEYTTGPGQSNQIRLVKYLPS